VHPNEPEPPPADDPTELDVAALIARMRTGDDVAAAALALWIKPRAEALGASAYRSLPTLAAQHTRDDLVQIAWIKGIDTMSRAEPPDGWDHDPAGYLYQAMRNALHDAARVARRRDIVLLDPVDPGNVQLVSALLPQRVVIEEDETDLEDAVARMVAVKDALEDEMRAATGPRAARDLAVFTMWWAGAIDPEPGPTHREIADAVTASGHRVHQTTVSRLITKWLTHLRDKMDGTD
jgi:DNA-directed RNA polymerase specialized sigma24 family protein